MILLELFNRVEGIESLEADDPLFKSNWYDAYVLNGERQDTVFFFVQLGIGMEKKFSFNFASFEDQNDEKPDGFLTFRPTGRGDQFRIYAAAGNILRDFLEREQPIYVSVEGYNDRQSALYLKALKRASVPEGYQVWNVHSSTMIVNVKKYRLAQRREREAEKRAETAHLQPLAGGMDGFIY